MQITRVYESDSFDEMARKIYNNFEIGQSCSITGFLMNITDPVPKGLMVVQEIERMDKYNNMHCNSRDRKWRRRRVKPEDSIGDYTAQKQWRFKKTVIDNKIKYDIWRTQ